MQQPGRYPDNLLRTLQRRMKIWRSAKAHAMVFGPMNAEWNGMPTEISRVLAEGQALATDPVVDAQLASLAAEGQRAVANGDRGAAKTQLMSMRTMNEQLAQQ